MISTLKIRVYPNLKQRELFEKYFGYNRSNINLLKVIIFNDKVVAKVAD